MAELHLAQQLIDILWPVGSVYISTDAANPSTKFGGTWSQITGGGQGHTHTLNNHQHTIPYIECYVWKRMA